MLYLRTTISLFVLDLQYLRINSSTTGSIIFIVDRNNETIVSTIGPFDSYISVAVVTNNSHRRCRGSCTNTSNSDDCHRHSHTHSLTLTHTYSLTHSQNRAQRNNFAACFC